MLLSPPAPSFAFNVMLLARRFRDEAGFAPTVAEAAAQAIADSFASDTVVNNLATKHDLVELRTELKQDITELRTELKQDITGLKTELTELRTELKTEVQVTKLDIIAQIERGKNETLKIFIAAFMSLLATFVALILGLRIF